MYLKTIVFQVYKVSAYLPPPLSLSLSHCSLTPPTIYAYVNNFRNYVRNFDLRRFLKHTQISDQNVMWCVLGL